MVSCFISRLVILIFGTLYPAYASYKAVRTKDVKEYVKWMMYWIVFALFTCAETFTDVFMSFWFPFYYEIKIITVIYLLSPATKGSSILYRKFVHPVLTQREQEIDEYIAKAKEQGYHTLLNLGSKGVNYATNLIMQTALKGGGGLVSQLRKSYSLGDLSEEQHLRSQMNEYEDSMDGRNDKDPRVYRRYVTPRRTISGASQDGLYFPEVDAYERPIGLEAEHLYSRIPSSEEISSGYSSGDPLFYGVERPKRDHLVRTASLGGSNRVRTRAATKAGLPKRSSLSEGGSTWSAVESCESQFETDGRFNFPLSQSQSVNFPLTALAHLVRPEYQHVIGGIPQQMLMFPNPYNCSPFSSGVLSQNINIVGGLEADTNPDLNNTSDNSTTPNLELNVSSENNSANSTVDVGASSSNELNSEKVDVNISENVIKKEEVVNEGKTEAELMNEKTEVVNEVKESVDDKDKKLEERSGKHNKKPAPKPPVEDNTSISGSVSTLEEDSEGSEFCTPNSSPQSQRKLSTNEQEKTAKSIEIEAKIQDQATNDTETQTKNKTKTKKGEFNISKKLHLPKMSFSFWHQKGGKQSSGSENSSVASVEIASPKKENDNSDLELFIPLKGEDTVDDVKNEQ